MNLNRCAWCLSSPLYQDYHDTEWGVPLYDNLKLFEFLMLEGMQAGLSWITILKKRDNLRAAFAAFQPDKMVCFSEKKIETLMQNEGIIRNRRKIMAMVQNANAYLQLNKTISFSDFLWQFVDGTPRINVWQKLEEVPAETECSRRMSQALKKQGFNFVGPTICYAFMQATGMVNDHLVSCYRHPSSVS